MELQKAEFETVYLGLVGLHKYIGIDIIDIFI